MINRFALLILTCGLALHASGAERPNILWLSSEDNGPHIGAYGDPLASTPNLDKLAAQGVRYERCWSNVPVCAPARTTILMGMYTTSTGTHHMRSHVAIPDSLVPFPKLLREAGYYCTNNVKEDYNIPKPEGTWDESSRKAHWNNRAPDQPFFAVFNYTRTHESQIRDPEYTPKHDPKQVQIPAFHPDAPEVRRDWAQYYDRMEGMDTWIGEKLTELEDAGLAEDTIIFYWGDHGIGLPRHKRECYDSGLRVPLIVHIPEKWKHLASDDYTPGQSSDRLVGFVDLGPTTLSLAGVTKPSYMHGSAFLGEHEDSPKPYLIGKRGRMDERIDMVRAITDGKYIYVRHYWPHRPRGQFLHYMFITPTTQVWKQQYDAGTLNAAQSRFWGPREVEELYDLSQDPDEVNNLIRYTEHDETATRLRAALREHILSTRDAGFLPEQEMHDRAEGRTVHEMAHDKRSYPLETILEAAERATDTRPEAWKGLLQDAQHSDSAVRYWAATGLLARCPEVFQEAQNTIYRLMDDPAPEVRITAMEIVARFGESDMAQIAVSRLLELAELENHPHFVAVAAMNALDYSDEIVASSEENIEALGALSINHDKVHPRNRTYVQRLIEKTLADLGHSAPQPSRP